MEKRHLSPQGNHLSIENPGSIPPHEIRDMLFDGTPKNIFIKNGHSSLRIPNETLEAINSLPPKTKVDVMAKISHALRDASSLIIIPKK